MGFPVVYICSLLLFTACWNYPVATAQTNAPELRVFQGTLVHSRVSTEREVLQDHLIGVDENSGDIVFVRPASERESLAQQHGFSEDEVVTLTNSQFLMPGLVDTHFHPPEYHRAALSLEEGFGAWSVATLLPGELRFRNVTIAAEQSTAFVREQLRLGTTTAVFMSTVSIDANFELARVADQMGQRTIVGKGLIDLAPGFPPEVLLETTQQAINNTQRFIDMVRGLENPLVQPAIALYGDFAISEELQQGLAEILARETDVLVMAHFADARPAFEGTLAQWLGAGLLPANRSLMVHSVNLRENEIQLYTQSGLSIAHCPATLWNLNFGRYLDVRRMLNLGIDVGLGSDVAAGVSPFILRTMRVAHHVSRAVSFNFSGDLPAGYDPLTIDEVFYLATLGGAQAIALGDTIGNFEVGKQFDALLIDTQAPSQLHPVFYSPDTDTLDDAITKFFWLGDDRNIQRVYIAGRMRFSRDELSREIPLRISFTNNSPRIVGRNVFVDMNSSKPTSSVTCYLRDVTQGFSNGQNCSSLNIMYTNLNAGRYILRIVANAGAGERDIIRRAIRIGTNSNDCTVNLINSGIVVQEDMVSIQFLANGNAVSHVCQVDRQPQRQCFSETPVIFQGLSSGQHRLQVLPRGCTGMSYKLSTMVTVP